MVRRDVINMPLPLIKLATLFVKQLSKPLVNAVKHGAKSSPRFKKICMFPAELYHKYEVNVKMNLLGLGKSKNVRPLNPDAAVQLGAEMIGEVFLYAFAVGILYTEYYYSSKASGTKEEEKKQYFQGLDNQITDLGLSAGQMEAEIRELQRKVGELESENKALTEKVFSKSKKGWI